MRPPLGGFGPFAFRTLSYMPALGAVLSQEKRECLLLANVAAALMSKTRTSPVTTWRERVKQIDEVIDAVAKGGAR